MEGRAPHPPPIFQSYEARGKPFFATIPAGLRGVQLAPPPPPNISGCAMTNGGGEGRELTSTPSQWPGIPYYV